MRSIICLFIFLLLVVFRCNAYDFEANGIYYEVVSLSDFECVVVSGGIPYSGDIKLPSEVEYKNKKLRVTGVGEAAFMNNTNLISISLPDNITSIGVNAFYSCNSLSKINFPNSIKEIKMGAFYGCSSLKDVLLPQSIISIGSSAFANCTSLEGIDIPDSVENLGTWAFNGCSSLENVRIGAGIKKIQYGSFGNCDKLSEIRIPGTVDTIIQYMKDNGVIHHYWINNPQKIYLENSMEPLSPMAYWYESKRWVYADWSQMQNLEYIYIDRNLNEYEIPLPNVKEVQIGANISKVDLNFGFNTVLESIKCEGIIPPIFPVLSKKLYMDVEVNVPQRALNAYQSHECWKNFWNIKGYDDGYNNVGLVDSGANVNIITGIFSIDGYPVDETYNGLVIICYSNGERRKIMMNDIGR